MPINLSDYYNNTTPSGVDSNFTRGQWQEKVPDYLEYLNEIRTSMAPDFENQQAQLANLYRRRGLSGSGIEGGAMNDLSRMQTAGLASQAAGLMGMSEQARQAALNRIYGEHTAEADLSRDAQFMSYQPKESGLTGALGALGSLAGAAIPGVGQATALMGLFGGGGGGGTAAPTMRQSTSGFNGLKPLAQNAVGNTANVNQYRTGDFNIRYPGLG